ncbi:hypothetical protein H4J02_09965 [Protaetiibacter sp. SSC-01]|uniref:hypothetical protein n=1 Tax=Protaetiibacter sp. SSC-01 TaxID=2759943 RepID=UPI0016573B4F|nr:hypothetical protein [Protaetiibacter sp. SSC-01]QNO36805.1 hypothetical protein H4J02_09965 [Protaetiibacter sp. SSC-01]
MSDVAPPAVPQPAPDAPEAAPVAPSDPLRIATPSPWGHAVVAALALVGIVLNVIGGAGFPAAAPVEWLMNAGLTIDLVAVLIACGIGVGVTLRARPVRPALVFPWLGLGLSAVALLAWAVGAVGLYETLFFGGRGRYMEDVGGAFLAGIPWALGAIFSAYGIRRGTQRRLNVAAWVGIAMWAIVLVGVLASALLYAADLTD